MTAAATSARCVGQPVSWLRLERYHLGELGGEERKAIEGHLSACPACAACLDRIEKDDEVALPELPAIDAGRTDGAPAQVPSARASPADGTPTLRGRWLVRASAIAGTLAAAAAILLYLRAPPRPADDGSVAPTDRVKGEAVAFSLVRDDGARIDGPGGTYSDGDRFKAVVTCAPGTGMTFDVVVYDRDGASFPLEQAPAFGCGNEVPLPGAFRLTGRDDERVCLVWARGRAVQRGVLAREAEPLAEGVSRSCLTLRAAPGVP